LGKQLKALLKCLNGMHQNVVGLFANSVEVSDRLGQLSFRTDAEDTGTNSHQNITSLHFCLVSKFYASNFLVENAFYLPQPPTAPCGRYRRPRSFALSKFFKFNHHLSPTNLFLCCIYQLTRPLFDPFQTPLCKCRPRSLPGLQTAGHHLYAIPLHWECRNFSFDVNQRPRPKLTFVLRRKLADSRSAIGSPITRCSYCTD
jgi:hypothetical protein